MKPSTRVIVSLLGEPNESHLAAIRAHAEWGMNCGVVSEMPTFEWRVSRVKPFVAVTISFPAQDYGFWMGFHAGMSFTRAERQLVLNCKCE